MNKQRSGGMNRFLMLICMLVAGLTSVVVGQRILAIENAAITIAHCQRLNLQNIFFLNQSRMALPSVKIEVKTNPRLPGYCDSILPSEIVKKLEAVDFDVPANMAAEDLIRLYSDSLSAIEDSDSRLKRNLLVALVGFNVLALSIESLILYLERKEIESEGDL